MGGHRFDELTARVAHGHDGGRRRRGPGGSRPAVGRPLRDRVRGRERAVRGGRGGGRRGGGGAASRRVPRGDARARCGDAAAAGALAAGGDGGRGRRDGRAGGGVPRHRRGGGQGRAERGGGLGGRGVEHTRATAAEEGAPSRGPLDDRVRALPQELLHRGARDQAHDGRGGGGAPQGPEGRRQGLDHRARQAVPAADQALVAVRAGGPRPAGGGQGGLRGAVPDPGAGAPRHHERARRHRHRQDGLGQDDGLHAPHDPARDAPAEP